jgi:predicted nucleotidyltransferase
MMPTGVPAPRQNVYMPFKLTGRLRMAKQALTEDFKEFLTLLNENNVEYLLIGGYAVGYYGYPRTTADMDVWIAIHSENARKMVAVFNQFGLRGDNVNEQLFQQPGHIVRMGIPPVRIEVLNEIDGVEFKECFANCKPVEIDGVPVSLISLADLRRNKLAAAQHKDLDDIEHLPEA